MIIKLQHKNVLHVPSGFTAVLTLKRRPEFFIFVVLVPIISLSAVAAFVFVLPKTSGERASFATTMMLAFTMFMTGVSDFLPTRSDTFPVIIHYIVSLTALNSFTVVFTVIQMRFCPPDENGKDDGNVIVLFKNYYKRKSVISPTNTDVITVNVADKGFDIGSKTSLRTKSINSNYADDGLRINLDVFCFVVYLLVWFIINVYFMTQLTAKA